MNLGVLGLFRIEPIVKLKIDLMMKMLNDRVLLKIAFLLMMALPTVVQAQNFSRYNWYFGSSNQAIRFSRSDNSANLINFVQAPPLGTGGSAVASSKLNGDLLFYTDGVNVFDITNAPMPNGTALTSNSSANQPVAVAKVPGQVSQYYIFTNSANFTAAGTISFSIVDMAQNGNSIAPAPPKRCPVIDLVDEIQTFLAWSFIRVLIALDSKGSPIGVLVPWALM